MNEYEAKYNALMATIDDPEMIENAEKLVRTAYNMSSATALPFRETFYAMLDAVQSQQITRVRVQKLGILARIKLALLAK